MQKKDKLIVFTELNFQPFSGKFVTIIQCPTLISWTKSAFWFHRIFYPWPNL